MSDRLLTSRRTVLKGSAVLLGSGVAASTAGCLGDDGGSSDGTGDSFSPVEYVPAGADSIFYADVSGMLADSGLQSAVNDQLSALAETRGYTGPTSVQQLLDMFGRELGLDPRNLQDLVVFGSLAGSGSVGFLVRSNWSESAFVDALTEQGPTTLSESEYEGTTVYESTEDDGELAVLSEGTYLLGEGNTARTVVDVQDGRADPMGGELREVYDDSRGLLQFAATVPEGSGTGADEVGAATSGITHVGGSLYTTGGNHVARLRMVAPDQDTATDLVGTVEGGMALARDQLEEGQSGGGETAPMEQIVVDATEVLEEVEVSRDAEVVSAKYAGQPADVAGLIVLAGGVLVNTAGFFQSRAEETGEESTSQVTNRLQVVSITGTDIEDRSIGTVEMIVTRAAGSDDIDLRGVTVGFTDTSGTYMLVHEQRDGPATFSTSPIKDPDGTHPVLTSSEDRYMMRFKPKAVRGSKLTAGEDVELKLTTKLGGQTMALITVPDALRDDENAVSL